MNRTYALVWNPSLGSWSVADEHAQRRGKGAGAVLAAALLLPTMAFAADLPTGGTVISGSGQIGTPNANQMVIDQGSNKLAIDWQSFDIGTGNKVTFNQPGSDSIALNRVLGADGSKIMGTLEANGQVFLVNPNGVLFGQGASVNVGGLVASTLDIANDDFEAGNHQFKGNGGNASVTNNGSIRAADGGSIALLGGTVSNNGVIVANQGTVALAAGNAVTLDFAGDGLLNVQVDEAVVDALVENHQLIKADGGQVLLTANAGDALLKTVINNTGVIEAQTLGEKDGKIVLLGSFDGGTVQVAGTLDASAPNGGDGGFIETSGAHVKVADSAKVTTKATDGKTGTWLIDPNDFTIAASGGDMTGTAVSAALQNNNFEIQTATMGTAGGNGDIHVNAEVKWSSDTVLTLTAERNINLNAGITASGNAAGLVLNYAGNDYQVKAPVTLSGANATLNINGNAYTLIHSMAELDAIDTSGLGGRYALAQDLDASNTTYNQALVGVNGSNPFTGTFAGLGHYISGLVIDSSAKLSLGLFGYTGPNSVIRDVGLLGGSVNLNSDAYTNQVGGLVGINQGTLSNVWNTGSVSGYFGVGGLVGDNGGTVRNAYATGRVSGQFNYVGGLIGSNSGTIDTAYATGNVSGYAGIGGLVGTNSLGGISNAYATGNVSGSTSVGGLVGYSYQGAIVNASWDATNTGRGQAVGSGTSTNVNVSSVDSSTRYNHSAYASLGTWNLVAGTHDVYAVNGFNGAQWIMIEGQTRPFLASEYSTTIRNAHQLQLMAYDRSASYTLANDIDASATVGTNAAGMWSTKGFMSVGDDLSLFNGQLDGGGHVISGLTINRPGEEYIGLFGYAGSGSAIRNLGLVGGSVFGNSHVGGLVGYLGAGTVNNVYVTSTVSGEGNVIGGLAGANLAGTISNAYVSGNVAGFRDVGGLVGANSGTISNTYTTGNVGGTASIGGLVGTNEGSVGNSYTTGSVAGTFDVGGLLGVTSGGYVTASFYATTDAQGNVINNGGNTSITFVGNTNGTAKTALELTRLSTFAGWDIDDAGGTANAWRIYDGYSGPLLRALLTRLTINADGGNKTYDGSVSAGTATYTSSLGNALDTSKLSGNLVYTSNSKNAGTYSTTDGTLLLSGLHSVQLGYDITFGSGSLTIAKADLAVSGISAADKTYDGTRTATLTGNGVLTGTVFGQDVVTLANTGIGTFDDKNAGTGKTLIVTGYTLTGNDAGNYTLVQPTGLTADIARADLAVTGLTASGKTYDGSDAATLNGSAGINAFSGDDVSLMGSATSTFADKHAGTGKAVTVTGYSLTGSDADNYTLVQPTGLTADIARADLAVTGVSASGKIYDGSDAAALNGTAGITALSGDLVSLTGTGTGSFADKHAGTGKAVTVTGYSLTGSDADNYTLIQPTALTADIARADLAVTGVSASGKIYDGSDAAALNGTAGITALSGDLVSLTGTGTGTFADKHAGTGKAVTVTGYSLTGSDADNYTLIQPTGLTADIARADLAVTGITASGKTYDGSSAATLNGTAGITALSGDLVSLTGTGTGTFADKHAGTSKAVTVTGYSLTGSDADNYTLIQPTGLTADIARADLTVTGLTASGKTYDGSNAATLNGTAGINAISGDDISLTGSATSTFADKHAGTGKAVTVTGYNLTGSDADNYTLVQPTGLTANIARADLTITGITAGNKTYDGSNAATLNGTAGINAISGDDVSLTGAATGSFADKNAGIGKAVTVTGYGLTGTDADNYNLVQPTGLSATIDKAGLTVTGVSANDKTYDGSNTATLLGTASVSAISGDVVSVIGVGTGSFADKNAGIGKAVTVTGYSLTGGDADNYTLTQPTGLSADIDKASLFINPDNASKVAGQSITLSGYSSLGLMLGDSITSVSLSSGGEAATAPAGDYSIVVSGAQGIGLDNYSITYTDGTLTVDSNILSSQPYIGAQTSNGQTGSTGARQQAQESEALSQDMLITQPLDERLSLQVINHGIRLPEGI